MPLSKDSISVVVEEAYSSGIDSSSRLLLLDRILPGAAGIRMKHPKRASHQMELKGVLILLASSQHYFGGGWLA